MTTTTTFRPGSTFSVEASEEFSPLLVPRPFQVIDKVGEGADITTLHVVPVSGSLFSFEPAQVSMLGAFGVGEATISISSPCDNTDFHAYTIRRAGPISGALVDTPVGGSLTVRGPFGNAWPLADIATENLVVVGGGLGIAPLRAMLHAVATDRRRFTRVGFCYGAKSPRELLFRDDLTKWEAAGVEVATTVDAPDPKWTGAVGVVPALLDAPHGIALDWSETSAFVCGPDVMMHFTAERLLGLGVPAERIWLTLERNMQCGNALCGHCQLGPFIVCRDGPVANYADIGPFHRIKDL